MKNIIIYALAFVVLAAAGCSKDELGTATVGGSKYEVSTAGAYQESRPGWTNIELIIGTDGCQITEDDIIGNYFYVDLYWNDEVRDRLIEGSYTLGGDVLDEVSYTFDDDNTPDISATEGTLDISKKGNNYNISFSGTASDGSKMEFNYSGPVKFMEM